MGRHLPLRPRYARLFPVGHACGRRNAQSHGCANRRRCMAARRCGEPQPRLAVGRRQDEGDRAKQRHGRR